MNALLSDFTNACGFFEGDSMAWQEACKMSKNQMRKLKRYAITPTAFFDYLAQIEVIRKVDIPKRPMTQSDLLTFLGSYPYHSEQARSDGMYIREAILQADIPLLDRSFAKGDFNWTKLQLYGAKQKQINSRI